MWSLQRGSVLFRGHFCDVAFTTDSMDLLEKIARIIKGIVCRNAFEIGVSHYQRWVYQMSDPLDEF